MKNIDTGMGLDRMAAILQDVPSVYEIDHVRPLIDLAEELSGHGYGEGEAVTRAMRIVADHSRGAAFLIADGVVPSNEDRGYILRRIMRRAIQQGRTLGLEAPWLGRFAERDDRADGGGLPGAGRRAGDDRPLGRRRGGELRPHPGARHRAAGAAGRRGARVGDLLDRRRRRLQAARHLRLPLRPDQGAARRAGPGGRRPGVRRADGGAAPARPHRGRDRARLRGPPREGAGLRRRDAAEPLRRLRDAARDDRARRGRAGRRPRPAEARGEPVLRRGRRPGRRLGRAALGGGEEAG